MADAPNKPDEARELVHALWGTIYDIVSASKNMPTHLFKEASEVTARAKTFCFPPTSPPVAAPPATPVAPTDAEVLAAAKNWGRVERYHRTDGKGMENRIVFEVHQRAAHFAVQLLRPQPQPAQPLTGGAPIAYSLQWPSDVELGRINISTTFDTEKEAREYADGCLNAETIRVVALVTAQQLQQAVARALEELKFHPQASHVEPNYRDWFNKTIDAAVRAKGTHD